MTDDKTKGRGRRPGLPSWVFLTAGALVVGAVAFYWWMGLHEGGVKPAWWALMGDAVGPFAALFNAGALLVALWAVHLQRQESHESAGATRKQLETMSQQVAEFARAADAQSALAASQQRLADEQHRANVLLETQIETENASLIVQRSTAKAQEALAASQARLADEQAKANREAAELRLAQHGNTIAILDAALAALKGAEIQAFAVNPSFEDFTTKKFAERRQSIGGRIDWELAAERSLLGELRRSAPEPREQEKVDA